MSNARITLLVVISLLTNSLSGCNRTNLSEYRPASEHAAPVIDKPSEAIAVIEETSTIAPNEDEQREKSIVEEPFSLPVSALVPVNVVGDVRALMSVPVGNSKPEAGSANSQPTDVPSIESQSKIAPAPNQIELLVKDKKFQTEPKTGALRVSFDDIDLLKVLNMEPVVANADELMPEWLKGLDGKAVRIRGFMYPTYETEGIERFVLARDNQICCFGRDPKIYDLVQVDMKAGKTTNYIPATRAFDVVGTFRIKMLAEDGKPYGLYLIEQASVIDR
jgi:hypothetical protein